MNSYQRLKAENKRLREEIDTLVFNPDGAKGMMLKANYRLLKKVEEMWFNGMGGYQVLDTKGIIPQITQK